VVLSRRPAKGAAGAEYHRRSVRAVARATARGPAAPRRGEAWAPARPRIVGARGTATRAGAAPVRVPRPP